MCLFYNHSGNQRIIKLVEDHIHDIHGNWFTPDGKPPAPVKKKSNSEDKATSKKQTVPVEEKVLGCLLPDPILLEAMTVTNLGCANICHLIL